MPKQVIESIFLGYRIICVLMPMELVFIEFHWSNNTLLSNQPGNPGRSSADYEVQAYLSSYSQKAGNELDGDVGEAVYVLDGKVFSIADKLPFADIIREGGDRFYFKVSKGIHHFDFYVSSIVDNLDFAAKEDAVVVSISGNGAAAGGNYHSLLYRSAVESVRDTDVYSMGTHIPSGRLPGVDGPFILCGRYLGDSSGGEETDCAQL